MKEYRTGGVVFHLMGDEILIEDAVTSDQVLVRWDTIYEFVEYMRARNKAKIEENK